MEIMLKNKCCLYVIISIRLFSITICNLLIEFPSYNCFPLSAFTYIYIYIYIYIHTHTHTYVCKCVFSTHYIYAVKEEKYIKLGCLCCTLQAVGMGFVCRQFCPVRVSGFVLRVELCREYRHRVGLGDVYIKRTSECK